MTDLIRALILGTVEGLTEFLPISSTGHLILIGDSLHFVGGQTATFDVAIQLGAILAVLVAYFPIFKALIPPKSWFSKFWNTILIAIFPALIMGAAFHHIIKTYLFTPFTVALALVTGGFFMIGVEKWVSQKPKTNELDQITYKQALIIGLCQCASLWPGMSRSASSIMGGLVAGLDEEIAAKFSFIIAVPLMIAAVGYDLLKSWHFLSSSDLGYIAIGFCVAFLIALGSLKIMLAILKRFRLFPFAIYRIILGGFLLYVFL